ncbi:ATPase/histidine kinase/DNA gyrase B/HSP90 domain containing protein [Acanthamoeba castellanii str. Neff]|uniref:ATPase/histidine kinase/DNA gyrase B/HSP90 domain containing protein n=1 Tax=Acanthamoeba castellanii (strain ATCC 30010 / Neff) TaxID=1257118 RepID=L8HJR6_ACACF|nr:ATPase/histidine kinase/DNA gyrase B/HSP90 domain containing protein [Acanthamoeba castellanii str. Neff]ELR24606.1 ATPase/histidine kinase/DNA gyrase B/HSP90 domain containing protein [Acanthamoeba castellanii str. Neff]
MPLGVGVLDLLLTLVVLTDRNPRDLYYWFMCIPPLMLHARGLGSCAAALVLVLLQTSALRYIVSSSTVSLNGFRHTLLGASMSDGWLLVVVTVCAVGTRYSRDAVLRGQLRKALDEAARAKSDFLANISHELRTPMHGIIAMSSELQSTLAPNTKASQAVAIIADCADHLLSMVNDLLDVARIEAHQLELAHIPFSVVSETHKVIDMLRSPADKKHLEMTAMVDVASPQHVGDPVRFRQIVYSLLSNAIKFTPEKGAVSVTLTSRSDSGLIELTVRDTGIGISEDHIANLFSVDASVSRRYGGSGLGLAISKRLCDAMGGTIGVTSQPSQGSTFTVILPLPCAAAEPEADTATTGAAASEESVFGADHNRKQEREMKEEQDEDVGGAAGGAFAGLEVLLVEDNPINQLVGKRMLHSLGCNVTVVANGLECVQMLARGSDEVEGEKASTMYDIILMDCQMPVMDGFKATQHIRALEMKAEGAARHGSPSLPIIALTASATKEYSRKCVEVGMSDVLFKPLRREMLAAALAKWAPTAGEARGRTSTTSSTTTLACSSSSSPSPSSTTTATATTAQHISRSKSHNSSFPIVHSSPLPLHDSSTSPSSSSSSTAAGGSSRNRSRSLPMPVPPPRPSLASSSSASAVKSLRDTIGNPTTRRALLFTRKEST